MHQGTSWRDADYPTSEGLSKLGTIFKMANSPPRITTRRGGRAIKKISRGIRFSRGRGWCSDRWDKEHHPGGVHKEASRHFLGDAATPPRGDARRGIRSFQKETPQLHIAVSAALDAPLNAVVRFHPPTSFK